MTFAEKLFECQTNMMSLDDQLYEHICSIMGLDPADHTEFDDVKYDYYDASFELIGVTNPDLTLTDEQKQKFFALGFFQCWFNYTNGLERHMYFKQLPKIEEPIQTVWSSHE